MISLHVLLEPVAALFFQAAPRRIAGKAADEDLVVRVDRQPDAVGYFVRAHFRRDDEPHVCHRMPGHAARFDRWVELGIILQRLVQIVLDHVKRHAAAYRGAKAGGRAFFSPARRTELSPSATRAECARCTSAARRSRARCASPSPTPSRSTT